MCIFHCCELPWCLRHPDPSLDEGRRGLGPRSLKRLRDVPTTIQGSIRPTAFIPRPGPHPLTTCASCRQQLGSRRAWHCEAPSAQPCCKAEWPGSTAGRRKPHWLAVSHAPGMGAALPGGYREAEPSQASQRRSEQTLRKSVALSEGHPGFLGLWDLHYHLEERTTPILGLSYCDR